MGHFASGVTIMTTTASGRMHGMTVSAFASQSLDPLLILVSVERSTEMHKLVMASRAFAINILGEHGEGTARFFADNARLKGPEFVEGAYHLGVSGAPLGTPSRARVSPGSARRNRVKSTMNGTFQTRSGLKPHRST